MRENLVAKLKEFGVLDIAEKCLTKARQVSKDQFYSDLSALKNESNMKKNEWVRTLSGGCIKLSMVCGFEIERWRENKPWALNAYIDSHCITLDESEARSDMEASLEQVMHLLGDPDIGVIS